MLSEKESSPRHSVILTLKRTPKTNAQGDKNTFFIHKKGMGVGKASTDQSGVDIQSLLINLTTL